MATHAPPIGLALIGLGVVVLFSRAIVRGGRWLRVAGATTIAGALALVLCACPPSTTPQTVAHGSVATLEQAWVAGSEACHQYAVAQQSEAVQQQCAAIFLPLSAPIVTATAAVDTWTDGSQGQIACAAGDLAVGLQNAETSLNEVKASNPTVTAAMNAAIAVASSLSSQCVRADAGASDASPDAAAAAPFRVIHLLPAPAPVVLHIDGGVQ